MEKEPQRHEGEGEKSLAQFRDEITELAAEEARAQGGNSHFLTPGKKMRELNPRFDVSKLIQEDFDIWNAIKERTITMERFRQYANEVVGLDEADPARPSRMIFSDFAANVATPMLAEKEMGGEEE